jgi:hypothetical protein
MARGHIEIIQASEVAPAEMPGSGWPPGARVRVLSDDSDTGALTAVVSLPAGYRRGSGSLEAASDLFLISGTMRFGPTVRAPGFYQHTPAQATAEQWAASTDCELLLLSAGPPDFTPGDPASGPPDGQINLDTETMPWARGRHPGPPPGLFSKTLRHDPETGARVFLCGCVRRYDYPMIEYHDCHEEAYHIAGDMRMGTSGLMSPGSYFWRPPYVTHGPFYSHAGMIALMTVDGPLVNHYVTDPRRTPEENRAEAQTKPPPHDPHAAASH